MEEKVSEAVLKEVSGGRGTRKNNHCPRCGAEISGSIALPVYGLGVNMIYHCNGCNLSWIAESLGTRKQRVGESGYHMVGNELVGESLPDLGGYKG